MWYSYKNVMKAVKNALIMAVIAAMIIVAFRYLLNETVGLLGICVIIFFVFIVDFIAQLYLSRKKKL